MKKQFLPLFLILILLTSCRPKDKKAEMNDYIDNIELTYFGLEDKLFNYDLTNDKEHLCSLDDTLYSNNDTATITCEKYDQDVQKSEVVQKKVVIDNLFSDSINERMIKKLFSPYTNDAKYYFLKENDYGLTLATIHETSPSLYEVREYHDVIYSDDKVLTTQGCILKSESVDYYCETFDKNKIYDVEKLGVINYGIKISGVKEEYVQDYIDRYQDYGYIKYENNI